MALQPTSVSSQEFLQPGARGEIFNPSLPGYRDGADRINRTNNFMNVSEHDVPNVKYEFDHRLPVLFKYGFDFGYNQIVIPKGRLVSADPSMLKKDFESQKKFNTLTLANGGTPVRLRTAEDKYSDVSLVSEDAKGKVALNAGKDWTPVQGMDKAYADGTLRSFVDNASSADAKLVTSSKQLTAAGFAIDAKSGQVVDGEGTIRKDVRPGNIPLGVLQRNEYTRNDDAYNGIAPGPVLTDSMIELPWFLFKNKAESNPWGSAYGNFYVGALVKSDENGRFVISPLSSDDAIEKMSAAEIELERQQVVGQIYSVNTELVPEGAAKWAEWALEDKLRYEGFNPLTFRNNNRDGEDTVNASPFNSKGEYPGYPYDKNFLNSDLHMLASTGRKDNYDPRMNPEFRIGELGIPGLTDGGNLAPHDVPAHRAGLIHAAGGKDYERMFFRTLDVNVEPGTLQISIGGSAFVNCTVGTVLHDAFVVTYANELQGIVVLEVTDKEKADAFLANHKSGAEVQLQYKKRGMVGVPTFMDWDSCVGSVKILMTK